MAVVARWVALVAALAKANPLLTGALIAGGAVRVAFIAANAPPSFDEVITLQLAQVPLLDSWRYVSLDNVPPLYTWLLHWWGSLFGYGPAAARTLSALFAAPTCYLVYRLGRDLGGRGLGRWAATIFALAPFSVYYTIFIRAYSMLFLFSAASLLVFWHLLNRPSPRRAVLFAILTAGLLYSGSVGLGLVVAQAAFALLYGRARMAPGRPLVVICGAIGVASFVPWLAASLLSTSQSPAASLVSSGWYFGMFTSTPSLFLAPAGLLINSFPFAWGQAVVTLYLTVPVALLAFGLTRLWRNGGGRPTAVYIGITGLLPIMVWSLMFSSVSLRYFIPSAVALYLAFAAALQAASGWAAGFRYRRGALVILGAASVALAFVHGRPSEGPGGVASWLESSPVTTVLADPNGIVLTYVGLGREHLNVVYPPAVSEHPEFANDDLYNLIAFNWSGPFYRVSDAEFPALRERVSRATNGSASVNVVMQFALSKSIKLALEDIGYRCVDYFPKGEGGSRIVTMQRGVEVASSACRAMGL